MAEEAFTAFRAITEAVSASVNRRRPTRRCLTGGFAVRIDRYVLLLMCPGCTLKGMEVG